MIENILDSIKVSLGISPQDSSFDTEIFMHINSTFASLSELGVGPDEGFEIKDGSERWVDFYDSEKRLNHLQSYAYLRVRLLFDPPQTAHAIAAFEKQIEKLEWLLTTTAEEISRPPEVVESVVPTI